PGSLPAVRECIDRGRDIGPLVRGNAPGLTLACISENSDKSLLPGGPAPAMDHEHAHWRPAMARGERSASGAKRSMGFLTSQKCVSMHSNTNLAYAGMSHMVKPLGRNLRERACTPLLF